LASGETVRRRSPFARAVLIPKLEVSLEERALEIETYLKLFGYKPERTLLYIYLPPSGERGFGRKYTPEERERLKRYRERYGGSAFTIIGHTHDPVVLASARVPKNFESATRYSGSIPPPDAHLKLPPDFSPVHLKHEDEEGLKRKFGSYLIAMYVPTLQSMGEEGRITRTVEWKNTLLRKLYRVGKNYKPEQRWRWINELMQYGYQELSKA